MGAVPEQVWTHLARALTLPHGLEAPVPVQQLENRHQLLGWREGGRVRADPGIVGWGGAEGTS